MDEHPCVESVDEFLRRLRDVGANVWVHKDGLRYRAPKGALSQADIRALVDRKATIAEFLRQDHSFQYFGEPPLERRCMSDSAPLTYAQQWHWSRWKHEKRRFRTSSTALSLHGRVRVDALLDSLAELVRLHESLRTTIRLVDGVRCQISDNSPILTFEVIDLRRISDSTRSRETKRQLRRLVGLPIGIEKGPIFDARIVTWSETEHVLMLARDQLISDAVSKQILLRDICTLYSQSARGASPALTQTFVQLADYAVWQERTTYSWECRHGAYWNRRLAGATRIEVFENREPGGNSLATVMCQPVRFDETLTSRLRDLSRHMHTTLAMSVLAIYAALLFRWCSVRDLVLPVITSGRSHREVENTVGAFAYPLFLRLELSESDDFINLLENIMEEYRSARRHEDFGRMAARGATAQIERNSQFNWISRELQPDTDEALDALAHIVGAFQLKPFTVEKPLEDIESEYLSGSDLDKEPVLILGEVDDRIEGGIVITGVPVPQSTVQRFERCLQAFAVRLAANPRIPVASLSCIP